MKEFVQALFLGIIQGLTEFLPVSSSGHMSIFRHFSGMATESSGLFSAMLHIGTLVAIFIVFYKPIYELFMEFFKCFKDLFARKLDSFKLKNMSVTRRMLFMFIIFGVKSYCFSHSSFKITKSICSITFFTI